MKHQEKCKLLDQFLSLSDRSSLISGQYQSDSLIYTPGGFVQENREWIHKVHGRDCRRERTSVFIDPIKDEKKYNDCLDQLLQEAHNMTLKLMPLQALLSMWSNHVYKR